MNRVRCRNLYLIAFDFEVIARGLLLPSVNIINPKYLSTYVQCLSNYNFSYIFVFIITVFFRLFYLVKKLYIL